MFVPSNEGEALVWDLLHLTDKAAIDGCISLLKDILCRGYPTVHMVWSALIKTNNDQAASARSGLKVLIKLATDKESEISSGISIQTVSLQVLSILSCYRMCAVGLSLEKGFPDSLIAQLSKSEIFMGDKECCVWILRRMIEASPEISRKVGLNTRAMTQIFGILRERISIATGQDESAHFPRRASSAAILAHKSAAVDLRRRPLSVEAAPSSELGRTAEFLSMPTESADGLRIAQARRTLRLAALPEAAPRAQRKASTPLPARQNPSQGQGGTPPTRPQRPSTAIRARVFAATSPQLLPRPPSAPSDAPPPLRRALPSHPTAAHAAHRLPAHPSLELATSIGGGGGGGARPWSGVSGQSAAAVLAGGGDEPLRLEGNCAALLAALALDGVALERQAQRTDVAEWVAALAWLLRHGGGSARLHAGR